MANVMIFVEPMPIEGILHWIESRVGKVVETLSDGDQFFCRTEKLASVEAICITQNMEYKRFVEVWFNYESAPWTSDVECARDAHAVLGIAVMCDPGRQAGGPSMFLQIDDRGEHLIDIDLAKD